MRIEAYYKLSMAEWRRMRAAVTQRMAAEQRMRRADSRRPLISDVADTRVADAVGARLEFVQVHGRLPTAESRTAAGMRPSEKTIRRRFGSFKAAIQRAGGV